MRELNEFIKTTKDTRELKRALAVKNTLNGRSRAEVTEELGVGESFIGKWRHRYATQGIEGLKLGYQGSSGYLPSDAKEDIMTWLQEHPQHQNVRSLHGYIQRRYGVAYRSRQSYYALLREAKLSWKKSQKRNPRADPEQVMETRDAIKKNDSGSAADCQEGEHRRVP
jgi:putative transposase